MAQEIGGTAIIGVGFTEITRHPERGIGQFAAEAVRDAIADAGIDKDEIDGYVGYPRSPSYSSHHFDGADEVSMEYMTRALGLAQPRWVVDTSGLALGMIAAARGALVSGMCDFVIGVRALYHESGRRYSHAPSRDEGGIGQFTMPYGLGPGGGRHAQWLNRYNALHGGTREDLYAVVAAAHRHAALNPRAYWRNSTLDLETYLSARWITEPLSLWDCDLPVAGAGAFVMTTTERARSIKESFAVVTAMSNSNHPRGAMEDSRLRPADLKVAQIYDGFSSFLYYWYEALGFCEEGTAHSFIQDGQIELGGLIPTNTFGGSLGEGRLHGIGHLREAVLQVTGRAGPRQVDGADHCLVQVGAPDRSWVAVLSSS
jgi:acetyl-CoA acetyltransferase